MKYKDSKDLLEHIKTEFSEYGKAEKKLFFNNFIQILIDNKIASSKSQAAGIIGKYINWSPQRILNYTQEAK